MQENNTEPTGRSGLSRILHSADPLFRHPVIGPPLKGSLDFAEHQIQDEILEFAGTFGLNPGVISLVKGALFAMLIMVFIGLAANGIFKIIHELKEFRTKFFGPRGGGHPDTPDENPPKAENSDQGPARELPAETGNSDHGSPRELPAGEALTGIPSKRKKQKWKSRSKKKRKTK